MIMSQRCLLAIVLTVWVSICCESDRNGSISDSGKYFESGASSSNLDGSTVDLGFGGSSSDIAGQSGSFDSAIDAGLAGSGGMVADGGPLDDGGLTAKTGDAVEGGFADSGENDAEDTSSLDECDPYVWPGYAPDLNYSYADDFPNIDPSTFKVFQGCDESLVAGVKTSGWWAFIWGHNKNPQITDAYIDQVLAGLNEDMGYARDVMGWPPDRFPKEGYFSSVYLYGSGLCTDDANNTATGGWQSSIQGYPMVLLSWAPVVNYDRGGITHEAIHAVLADMPGGRKAPWFNEGGNTWLQMNMEAERTGSYSVGFLDGTPFLAPHIPIECYSGWLQDGSFGGPGAEGVNQYRGSQQISTWRDYLGGYQYNSVFSHFLSLWVSPGTNAWIWNNPKYVNILETLADGLGEEQIRHLIMEYRARQALVDFKEWTDAFKKPVNDYWGRTIGAEEIAGGIFTEPAPYVASAYIETTNDNGLLTPSAETLPGWSGANQIPLEVNGHQVTVDFRPDDQNMRLQLVYRAADGTAVYSQPVSSGRACLRLDKSPAKGVVIAVVSNTDYVYEGESSRTQKYDYTIQLVEGASGAASRTNKYF